MPLQGTPLCLENFLTAHVAESKSFQLIYSQFPKERALFRQLSGFVAGHTVVTLTVIICLL